MSQPMVVMGGDVESQRARLRRKATIQEPCMEYKALELLPGVAWCSEARSAAQRP